jgi:chorismate mutase
MSPMSPLLGLVFTWVLAASSLGQQGEGAGQEEPRILPTGPAAKRADELLRDYTARIEKEIEQGRKEVERLRSELHQLIDVRDAMADAIGELRADLATKGVYSTEPVVVGPAPAQEKQAVPSQPQGVPFRRDLFYGLGSALPKEPSPQERERLRRLAPRADLKRMVERLRTEVEATRAEVDQLAYKLLELRAGVTASPGGFMGGMGYGASGTWFGSIGLPNMMGMGGQGMM